MRVDGTGFTGTVALGMLALVSAEFYRRSQTIVGHEAGGGGGDGCRRPESPALTPIPKPAAATPEEIAHVKLLDEAIAPVRDAPLSADDATRIRDAIRAIGAGKVPDGQSLKSEISDPIGRKLVEWYRLRSGYGDAPEYRAFLDQNPAWPDRNLMTQRLEEAPVHARRLCGCDEAGVVQGRSARTGIGIATLASALLAEGDTESARKLAAKAWREESIPSSLETGFLDRFKPLLTAASHKWRLDRLLLDDLRLPIERGVIGRPWRAASSRCCRRPTTRRRMPG